MNHDGIEWLRGFYKRAIFVHHDSGTIHIAPEAVMSFHSIVVHRFVGAG